MHFLLKKLKDTWSFDKVDPIKAEKAMVTSIQKLVGIYNVCGDKDHERFSILSVLLMLLFGGSFLYVGTFSQTLYLVQVFPESMETFKALNCLSATCVPLSKYIFMWAVRSRLRPIFEQSNEGLSSIPLGSAAHTSMMKTLQTARFARWFVIFNQAGTHLVYLTVPLLFTVFGSERYLPTTPGDCYGLSPKYETPFFELTFALTITATAFSAINQTGYIVLFVTFLAHDVGHFYAITATLGDIYKTLKSSKTRSKLEAREIVNEKLKFCIKHHQFLLRYHEKIKDLYKVIFGLHFLMMTIVLVTTLYTLNGWDFRNTIITAGTGILPLFIYCFGGELLITAVADMSIAVYTCGWEMMEVRQARCVLLMLRLSQRPLYLTAADVFIMNRETFGNVAQVVYKIYAVFN